MCLFGATGAAAVAVAAYRPLEPGSRLTTRVVVRPGMSAEAVGGLLRADGIIGRAWWFRAVVRWRGDGRLLQAGTYLLGPGMSPEQIVRTLVAGRVAVVRVTIPEGWTSDQIVARLVRDRLGSRRALITAADSAAALRALHLPLPAPGVRHALEGYLFPATYNFPLGATPDQIMSMMVRRFGSAWNPALARAARRSGLDTAETVTLASIVQSEVRSPRDMALVAGVYLNRLRRRMDLDADPTVLYGLGLMGGQTGGLTALQLTSASPYNTYRRRGLPPGPICNPGSTALWAAAHPAPVAALYFLTTASGRLVLADTLGQQIAHERRYGVG